MADLGLDGSASFEELCQHRGDAAPLTTDQDAGGLDAMPAIAAVDHGEAGPRIGQDLDLLQRRCQGVAVIRIAWEATRPDDRRGRLIGRTKGGLNTRLHARRRVADRRPGP